MSTQTSGFELKILDSIFRQEVLPKLRASRDEPLEVLQQRIFQELLMGGFQIMPTHHAQVFIARGQTEELIVVFYQLRNGFTGLPELLLQASGPIVLNRLDRLLLAREVGRSILTACEYDQSRARLMERHVRKLIRKPEITDLRLKQLCSSCTVGQGYHRADDSPQLANAMWRCSHSLRFRLSNPAVPGEDVQHRGADILIMKALASRNNYLAAVHNCYAAITALPSNFNFQRGPLHNALRALTEAIKLGNKSYSWHHEAFGYGDSDRLLSEHSSTARLMLCALTDMLGAMKDRAAQMNDRIYPPLVSEFKEALGIGFSGSDLLRQLDEALQPFMEEDLAAA